VTRQVWHGERQRRTSANNHHANNNPDKMRQRRRRKRIRRADKKRLPDQQFISTFRQRSRAPRDAEREHTPPMLALPPPIAQKMPRHHAISRAIDTRQPTINRKLRLQPPNREHDSRRGNDKRRNPVPPRFEFGQRTEQQ